MFSALGINGKHYFPEFPYCLPAFLAGCIPLATVNALQPFGVRKNVLRQLEAQPFMVALVLLILHFIPLNADQLYLYNVIRYSTIVKRLPAIRFSHPDFEATY